MNVMFSRLNYFPSFISNDCMEIGILFHDTDNDIRRFEITTNWSRVRSFDDELDIEYLKLILDGIKKEISNENLFNFKEKFNLKKYTKFYVNELKFTDVTSAEANDFESFIDETKRMFLRFDYEKSQRPTHDEQVSYMKRLLKENNVKYSARSVSGNFNENIHYDYIINGYAFKLFTFEDKRISKLVSSAKTWAFNAAEMKDQYKTIFIHDIELEDHMFKSIKEILSRNSFKVMKINEALDFIIKLKSSNPESYLQENDV